MHPAIRKLPAACLFLLLLAGCGGEGFDDGDYVLLTVELNLIGSRQAGGESPPSDAALRTAWRREKVDALLGGYGISEDDYLQYSLALQQDTDRYRRVLQEIAAELELRNQMLKDTEAPQEVKPPPGSFG